MNRQRLILFVLVIIFGVAVLWSYSALPRPKTVARLTYTSGQQVKSQPADPNKQSRDADDGTKLKVCQLDNEPAGFKGYRRNIFRPVFVDVSKTFKKNVAVIKPPSKAAELPAPPVVKPAAQEAVTIQPEAEAATLARFTFLGFLKKGSVKTIFLAKEKDILLVKKGDIVAGRYEATEISDQALTLTVSDTGDEIVIPLIENRPLAKSK